MRNRSVVAVAFFLTVSIAPSAYAQVTLDVAKITCEQFVLYKIADPDQIAAWLSGYYNGKRGNTLLDMEGLKISLRKLKDYCSANHNVTVMQAVETVIINAGK